MSSEGLNHGQNDEVEHHYIRGDVWFDDGNVVLVAEGHSFRVHRGMLIRKSLVFADMFAMAHPRDDGLVEGCPIIPLFDTSKWDVAHMLSAFYDPERYFDTGVRISFDIVSSMLRMGHKYQIASIKDHAIRRLRLHLPPRLQDFSESACDGGPGEKSAIDFRSRHAIAVISLARRFELYDLLPLSFYFCSRLNPQQLAGGYTDEEGIHWSLSDEDRTRCLVGRDTIRGQCTNLYSFVFEGAVSPECSKVGKCRAELVASRTVTFIQLLPRDVRALDDCKWLREEFQLCEDCLEHFESLHFEERKRNWDTLAVTFDLVDVVEWPPVPVLTP
ncbi:hypothetical protein BXZ70DRAFT_86681 [Cristinia sonorae]|uniref:BTB domain-containing protein n=1 Tax=Cristinia sonorae TaxID=1940300 RepID=A0A8K0UT23_9AGAR|nr:hypothetical protein BXZ70DRAFT_86681 [Cristinia sonorae]